MKNELAPPIMEPILNKRSNTYNLSNFQNFAAERKRTVWYGLDTYRWKLTQLPLSSTLVSSARKPQGNEFFKPVQKKY